MKKIMAVLSVAFSIHAAASDNLEVVWVGADQNDGEKALISVLGYVKQHVIQCNKKTTYIVTEGAELCVGERSIPVSKGWGNVATIYDLGGKMAVYRGADPDCFK